MKYDKSKVESLLEEGRVGLGNARATPEIAALLARYGYGDAELQEGETLRLALETAQAGQVRAYARQQEATAAFQAAWEGARAAYARHTKIARAVLTARPDLLPRLGLEGRRPQAFGAWLAAARQFYREALADAALQTVLAEGGLTAAALAAGQNTLAAAAQADSAQESAKGLAQQATQDRDAAAAACQEWLGRFWKIAAVGLAGQPQWMERLGHKVRS